MLSLKSPFPFDLNESIVCGEAGDEEMFNSIVRTHPEGGNTTVTSPMTCTPHDPTNINTHDFANALAQHMEALEANNKVVQELMQSVAGLTAAIKGMHDKTKFRGTCANIKAHNKKMKRYRDYVIKYLASTKDKKATRGTLRRNLVKLESRFLSHVLKDLIENKQIVKTGTTYALVKNVD